MTESGEPPARGPNAEGPLPQEGEGASPAPVTPPPRGWTTAFLELLRSVALVLVFFFLVRTFLVEAFKIPTASMEATLMVGDFLLVNKAVYGAEIPGTGLAFPSLASPERGEVIVFHPPHEPTKHYVKRLVGLPDDTLAMRDKVLYVNGRVVEEPYVRHLDSTGDQVHPAMAWQARFHRDGVRPRGYRPSRDNWGPLVVPNERYFVLGDNRDNSEDSRYWGFVRREDIKGRPWLVYYSAAPGALDQGSWLRYVRWNRIGGRIR